MGSIDAWENNGTQVQVDSLHEKYRNNMAVSIESYYSLIAAYSILILVGSIGNIMILGAVISDKSKLWFLIMNLVINFFISSFF